MIGRTSGPAVVAGLLFSLGAALSPTAAAAGPPLNMPPVQYNTSAIDANQFKQITTPGSVQITGCDSPGLCDSGTAGSFPSPLAQVSGQNTGSYTGANFKADVTYYYEIYDVQNSGPSTVTVHLTGDLATGAFGAGAASVAGVNYSWSNLGIGQTLVCSGGPTFANTICDGGPTFAAEKLNLTYTVAVDQLQFVDVYAQGDTGGPQYPGFNGNSAMQAMADPPMITIDAAELAQYPGLRIAFSPGLDVPEPETWALLMLGVGAIGASRRMARRRRGPPVAAA